MPATDMVTAVQAILPDRVLVTSSGPLTAETATSPAMGYIAPRLSGPTGPGQLHVVLSPMVDPVADSLTAETDPIDAEPTLPGGNDIHCPKNLSSRAQCSELTTADGTLTGRRTSITSGSVTTLEVVLRRDGGTIYAAATNRLDPEQGQQSSGVSADQPPLTLDQLEDLVRNDTWVMPAS